MRVTVPRRRIILLVALLLVATAVGWRAAHSGAGAASPVCGADTGVECREGVSRVGLGDGPSQTLQLSRLFPIHPPVAVLVGRNSTELSTAAGLATSLRGPLIMFPASGVAEPIETELRRLRPKRVIVVGHDTAARESARRLRGEGGLPSGTELTLVTGATPAEVSARATELFPRHLAAAYVITYQDAESAITVATHLAELPGPVLVTHYGSLPATTAQALIALAPRRLIVIGDDRKLADGVVEQIIRYAGFGSPIPVTRVTLKPRDAGLAVAGEYGGEVSEAYLVSSSDPVGASATAALAARVRAPLIPTGYVVVDDVFEMVRDLDPESVVVGSAGVVGPQTVEQVEEALER